MYFLSVHLTAVRFISPTCNCGSDRRGHLYPLFYLSFIDGLFISLNVELILNACICLFYSHKLSPNQKRLYFFSFFANLFSHFPNLVFFSNFYLFLERTMCIYMAEIFISIMYNVLSTYFDIFGSYVGILRLFWCKFSTPIRLKERWIVELHSKFKIHWKFTSYIKKNRNKITMNHI